MMVRPPSTAARVLGALTLPEVHGDGDGGQDPDDDDHEEDLDHAEAVAAATARALCARRAAH